MQGAVRVENKIFFHLNVNTEQVFSALTHHNWCESVLSQRIKILGVALCIERNKIANISHTLTECESQCEGIFTIRHYDYRNTLAIV